MLRRARPDKEWGAGQPITFSGSSSCSPSARSGPTPEAVSSRPRGVHRPTPGGIQYQGWRRIVPPARRCSRWSPDLAPQRQDHHVRDAIYARDTRGWPFRPGPPGDHAPVSRGRTEAGDPTAGEAPGWSAGRIRCPRRRHLRTDGARRGLHLLRSGVEIRCAAALDRSGGQRHRHCLATHRHAAASCTTGPARELPSVCG